MFGFITFVCIIYGLDLYDRCASVGILYAPLFVSPEVPDSVHLQYW